MPAFRLDPALERAQIERLRQTRASRSRSTVEESLAALEQAYARHGVSEAAEAALV